MKNIHLETLIYNFRGMKVIIDSDLASLYGVTTSSLNRAVKRNIERFPTDFMFQLSNDEILRCHFGIAKAKRRYLPYAFTENGIAMLSSVLRSDTAIQINIQIMRAFTKLRQLINQDQNFNHRLEKLEKGTSALFKITFDRLDRLETERPHLPSKKKKISLT